MAAGRGRSGHAAWRRTTPRGDRTRGRLNEAVGGLTDDDRLTHEGKLDQVGGKVKGKLEQAVEQMKEALRAKRPCGPAK